MKSLISYFLARREPASREPNDADGLGLDDSPLPKGGERSRLPLWATQLAVFVLCAIYGAAILIVAWEGPEKGPAARRTFQGHSGYVSSVAISPDGRTLISASWDCTMRAWDLTARTGIKGVEKVPTAQATEEWEVLSVALSTDGRTLAVGGFSSEITTRDAATLRKLDRLHGHAGYVRCVQFSADGRYLASGSSDTTARLWDAQTGHPRAVLRGHLARITCLAFSNDSRILATGSYDGTLRLWDVATGRELRRFDQGTEIDCLALAPDGSSLAAGGHVSAHVVVWDLALGVQSAHFPRGQSAGFMALAFSPDGRVLAAGGIDHAVRLWDIASGRERGPLVGRLGPVRSIAFAAGGTTLASGDGDGCVLIWDFTRRDESIPHP